MSIDFLLTKRKGSFKNDVTEGEEGGAYHKWWQKVTKGGGCLTQYSDVNNCFLHWPFILFLHIYKSQLLLSPVSPLSCFTKWPFAKFENDVALNSFLLSFGLLK